MVESNIEEEDEIIDVAQEANQLIAQKDKELKELKLKLARSELYRTVDEDEVKPEPYDFNKTFTPMSSDLDFAKHAINIHKYEIENPTKVKTDSATGEKQYTLGARAQDICDYLEYCVEESNDDKNLFHSIYYSNLSNDSSEASHLYSQSKRDIAANNIKYNIKEI